MYNPFSDARRGFVKQFLGLVFAVSALSWSASAQTVLTTYLGSYGSTSPSYVGPSQTIPARVFNPSGGAAVSVFSVEFKHSIADSTPEYAFLLFNDGGSFSATLTTYVGTVVSIWPHPTLVPNGVLNPLQLSVGTMQVTAYRLALVGNELQLDLQINRSDTFSDQIAMWAQAGSAYSLPWVDSSAGRWTSMASGTPSSPTVLTTYLGSFGASPVALSGPSQMIAARAYNPAGAAGVTFFDVWLTPAIGASFPSYEIRISQNSPTFYSLLILNWTSGQAVAVGASLFVNAPTTSLNISTGDLTLTSCQLTFNGPELQLNLGLTRNGTFSSQIALWARADTLDSQPSLGTSVGSWSANATPIPRSPSVLSAVWANNGEDKVTQDDLRASQGASVVNNSWDGANVNIFGAANEVVSFNLILEAAQRPANGLSVSLPSLNGPGGYSISSSPAGPAGIFNWTQREIELFYVRYLPIKGLSASWGDTPYGDNLIPQSTWAGWHDERRVPKRFQLPFQFLPPNSGAYMTVTGAWTDRQDHDKFYPDIAVPIELYPAGFNIAQSNNQSIWVDVYIPKGAPGGLYTGTVAITSGESVVATVPVNLTVRSLTLPDVPSAKTMLYADNSLGYRVTGNRSPSFGVTDYQVSSQAYGVAWQVAHRHKISLVGDPYGDGSYKPSPVAASALTGNLFSSSNGYSGPGAGVGESVYPVEIYGNHSAWPESLFWQVTNGFESWFQSNAPQVDRFFYLCDECDGTFSNAGTFKTSPQTVNTWASWIKSNSGVGRQMKTFATVDLYNAQSEPNVDEFCVGPFGYGNIPNPANPTSDSNIPYIGVDSNGVAYNAVQTILSRNQKTCAYNPSRQAGGSFLIDDDGVALREFAWASYYKGVSRMFYWHSTNWGGTSSGDTDLFNTTQTWGSAGPINPVLGATGFYNGEGVLFYPSYDVTGAGSPSWAPYNAFDTQYNVPKGVFASLRLKHWRRGIQDIDYINAANAVNSSATQAVVQCMLKRNYAGPTAFWDTTFPWTEGDISWSINPDDWESARKQLADIIEGKAGSYSCPN